MTIYLPPLDDNLDYFPPLATALEEPDGLLAIGGDLHPARLLNAYKKGIFPWFGIGEPYLWWSPSERAIFNPEEFEPSRSLKKFSRRCNYRFTLNTCFDDVIHHCATIRGENQTWITEEMQQAYRRLHQLGHCHSIEVWHQDRLIGGFYGVAAGSVFCGESMFSIETNASKMALWIFCRHFSANGGKLIDCQMMNPHLESLGAQPLEREKFTSMLTPLVNEPVSAHCYTSGNLDVADI